MIVNVALDSFGARTYPCTIPPEFDDWCEELNALLCDTVGAPSIGQVRLHRAKGDAVPIPMTDMGLRIIRGAISTDTIAINPHTAESEVHLDGGKTPPPKRKNKEEIEEIPSAPDSKKIRNDPRKNAEYAAHDHAVLLHYVHLLCCVLMPCWCTVVALTDALEASCPRLASGEEETQRCGGCLS